jgi:hypothetical protein
MRKKMLQVLENWSLHMEDAPFKAPEIRMMYIRGEVNGEVVVRIYEGFDPETKTAGGFQLGKPLPQYAEWLKNNPVEGDPDPLRVYALQMMS